MESQGKSLPTHVHREFEAYLKCGRLEHGFLRYLFAAHPHAMGKVLGIIYRAISTHLIHKAGQRRHDRQTAGLVGGDLSLLQDW